MFESMRKVFGPITVSIIIGAIALVFVFFGVYNPRSNGSGMSGAVAASVNGETISMRDFAREYQQRVEFYQNMMKGSRLDPNMLKQLGLKQQVLDELIRRKLLLQEAHRLGLSASDEEVREKISELPYFKSKDGRFDASQYQRVLQANNLVPAAFEDMIRDDVLRAQIVELVKGQVKVSEREIEKEFLANEDRRQVEYVVVSRDAAKKRLVVADREVDELLKTETGLNSAKAYYERNKMAYSMNVAPPKSKNPKDAAKPAKIEFLPFEEVKRKVAAEVIKERRSEELTKLAKEMATDVLTHAKGTPAQWPAYVKSKGFEVKTSEKFNRLQPQLTGVGDPAPVAEDAFNENSVLSKEPKLYDQGGNFVVVRNLKVFKADLSNLAKEKEKLSSQISSRKEQAVLEGWMTGLREKAKVSINEGTESEDI